MAKEWTQQQKNAIYSTGGTVLVSAAAGSGKTAVLVERVIQMVTREHDPVDVDRLLIVTFTRAAAAEMKQRLCTAIDSLIKKDPSNSRLIKQKQLLPAAQISTIDSFCIDLVREHFHTLNISADFKTSDEGEEKVMSLQALDLAIEEFYSKGDKDFYELLSLFSNKNGDERLREVVLKISEFLSTQPFPDLWMKKMLDNHFVTPFSDTIWGKAILENACSAVSYAINLTETSLTMLDDEAELKKAIEHVFEGDSVFLKKLNEKLLSGNWNAVSQFYSTYKAARLAGPKIYKDHPLKLAVAKNRDEVKKTISSLGQYFSFSEEEAIQEIRDLGRLVSVLFDLVRAYLSELSRIKEKKNIFSFSDIELLTVRLLAQPDSGEMGYKKTTRASEIADRYDAVMVDEFQDVNDVQNIIFSCVSKEEGNLFVVGDVKQSIYGFRQAKPRIFIDRKEAYSRFTEDNPQYPATIILDKNFRSRKEVCDSVNFIFSRLMSKQIAQMDYTRDEYLNVGAQYPESNSCKLEIACIQSEFETEEDSCVLEANFIAEKIREMMSSGFTVTDNGVTRPATYGDFAVIMRNTKNRASKYVNTLIKYGIPAFCEKKENGFDFPEIKLMLSLLRVIDNPTLDIELLTVMCSPLYGFTPDELAQLRANGRYNSLYASLKLGAENSRKAAEFLSELERFMYISSTCTVNELITVLYEETAISAVTSAMRGSDSSNLDVLSLYARNFESKGFKTLSQFISYIDRLNANKIALPFESNESTAVNGVSVISIHASKGLEFPVCFIADTAHNFNKQDFKENVIIDSAAGLGIRMKNRYYRFDTLPRLAVEIEMKRNLIAEEMRILYVALTRAKEKLIVVSSQKNTKKRISELYSTLINGQIIDPYSVQNGKSYFDWIMLCALTNPSLDSLRSEADTNAGLLTVHGDEPEWICYYPSVDIAPQPGEEGEITLPLPPESTRPQLNEKFAKLLKRNLDYNYPNAEMTLLPQKLSASSITHSDSDFEKILQRPSFLSLSSSTGADRGTAHHRFLQYCDFASARIDVRREAQRLFSQGILDETQLELIDCKKLSDLLSNDLFTRVINSPKLYREERFTVKLNPSLVLEAYKDIETNAEIILQGALDLAFEENGKLIIVDYKTDRVSEPSILIERYKKQLELYRLAALQWSQKEVEACILCSIHLGKIIYL